MAWKIEPSIEILVSWDIDAEYHIRYWSSSDLSQKIQIFDPTKPQMTFVEILNKVSTFLFGGGGRWFSIPHQISDSTPNLTCPPVERVSNYGFFRLISSKSCWDFWSNPNLGPIINLTPLNRPIWLCWKNWAKYGIGVLRSAGSEESIRFLFQLQFRPQNLNLIL